MMSREYRRKQVITNRRTSRILPVFIRGEEEEIARGRRLSPSLNVQRRLSTVSQIHFPHGFEYHPQDYVPATGPEAQQIFFPSTIKTDQTASEQRRLSIVSQISQPIDAESIEKAKPKESSSRRRKILFILEPILSGLILFPILVLFWQCGWNLTLIFLSALNQFDR